METFFYRSFDLGRSFEVLLVNLSTAFPNTLTLGMEIRDKVVEYVEDRIQKLRKENEGKYGNCAVILTNAMKYLPNFFAKGQVTIFSSLVLKMQLKKIFFLFPDPHFKKSNHRRRIIR